MNYIQRYQKLIIMNRFDDTEDLRRAVNFREDLEEPNSAYQIKSLSEVNQ